MSANNQKIILCIDDDNDTCELVVAILGIASYQVDIASSAIEGMEKARLNHYDLILLDLRLGDGDGRELCRQIRFFDAKTPILFYSGEGRESHIEAALATGAQGFLLKPVDPDDLLKKISEQTEKKDSLAAH